MSNDDGLSSIEKAQIPSEIFFHKVRKIGIKKTCDRYYRPVMLGEDLVRLILSMFPNYQELCLTDPSLSYPGEGGGWITDREHLSRLFVVWLPQSLPR